MTIPFGPASTGTGPAAVQPPIPLSPLVPIQANRGRFYNGMARDWQLNVVGGNYQATADEIDAGMCLSMSIQQGSFKADLTLGNTLWQIKYLGSPTQHSDVVNRVVTSNPAARYIESGDVAIVAIVDEVIHGKLLVRVDYTKPKLGGSRKSAFYVPGGAPTDAQHNGITQNDGNTLVASTGEGVWL